MEAIIFLVLAVAGVGCLFAGAIGPGLGLLVLSVMVLKMAGG